MKIVIPDDYQNLVDRLDCYNLIRHHEIVRYREPARVRQSGAVFLVEASLNNVTGLFILDTGASLVSVTKSFANKAKISAHVEDKITLDTANGLSDGLLATASSVQVGNAYSTFVPVVILDDTKLGTDDNVVGLLGMSFLARFDMKFGKDTVELRSR
jgi:clan AA aspartic protease (TIGR02281 family)